MLSQALGEALFSVSDAAASRESEQNRGRAVVLGEILAGVGGTAALGQHLGRVSQTFCPKLCSWPPSYGWRTPPCFVTCNLSLWCRWEKFLFKKACSVFLVLPFFFFSFWFSPFFFPPLFLSIWGAPSLGCWTTFYCKKRAPSSQRPLPCASCAKDRSSCPSALAGGETGWGESSTQAAANDNFFSQNPEINSIMQLRIRALTCKMNCEGFVRWIHSCIFP